MAARKVTAADIMGAAIHEAAHAVAAEAFGAGPATVTLEVKRNASGDGWISGTTTHKPITGRNGVTLALAGAVAEVLHSGSAWRHARGPEFLRAVAEKTSGSDRFNAMQAAGRSLELADTAVAEAWVRQNLAAIESRALREAEAFADRQRGVTAPAAARPAALARGAAADDGDDGPGGIIVMVRGQRLYAKSAAHAALLAHDAAQWRGPGTGSAQVL